MAGRRKSIFVGVRFPKRTVGRPIKVPQPPDRPVRLHKRDLLRKDLYDPKPWWQIVHRRGLRRTPVGMDPREARAVPHEQVAGTLPERIVYAWLSEHRIPFDFQSSLQGGRLEFGGIVADFILPDHRYVLNPAGPTHDTFLRQRKDEEQSMVLAEFGYRVFFIDDDVCYNESRFEETMRAILNLGPTWGGGVASVETHNGDGLDLELLADLGQAVERLRNAAFAFRESLLADWATQ
jgi:very-short-patch-repair endonuclease